MSLPGIESKSEKKYNCVYWLVTDAGQPVQGGDGQEVRGGRDHAGHRVLCCQPDPGVDPIKLLLHKKLDRFSKKNSVCLILANKAILLTNNIQTSKIHKNFFLITRAVAE